MNDLKKQLRKQIFEKQARLSEAYLRSADSSIADHVFSLAEYKEAQTVFCFVSMETEINTVPILEDCFSRNVRVCVPRCVGRGIMEAREIQDFVSLKRSPFGILEPTEAHSLIDPGEIDFALVPCVSCNKKGARLGHGGGFYDRFLLHIDGGKALICREQLLLEEIPMANHDLFIPTIITENGVTRI